MTKCKVHFAILEYHPRQAARRAASDAAHFSCDEKWGVGARHEDLITISLGLTIGTDNDFDRPSGTAVFLYRYPGTSYLATILLSLRDKMHAPAKASLS